MLNKLFFFPSYQNNKIPNIYKLTIYSTSYLMKRKIKLEQHVKKPTICTTCTNKLNSTIFTKDFYIKTSHLISHPFEA